MILKFGKHKGKDLKDVPTDYLLWLIENSDISDPLYGEKNKLLVQACHVALNAQADQKTPKKGYVASATPTKNEKVEKLLAELRAQIEEIYKDANAMRDLIDVFNEKGEKVNSSQNSPY